MVPKLRSRKCIRNVLAVTIRITVAYLFIYYGEATQRGMDTS